MFNLDKTTIDTSNTENNNNTDKLSAKNYENLNQYDKNLINKLTEILDNNNFTELSKIATQCEKSQNTKIVSLLLDIYTNTNIDKSMSYFMNTVSKLKNEAFNKIEFDSMQNLITRCVYLDRTNYV